MDYLFVNFNFLQLPRKPRVLRELRYLSLSCTSESLNFLVCLMVNHFSYRFFFQEFDGNIDYYSVVHHDLNPPITERYIRFRPLTWNVRISMRVEIYGCTQGNFLKISEL